MVNLQQLDQQILYLQSQLASMPNPPQTQQQANVIAQLQAQLNQLYAQKQAVFQQQQQQMYNQQMGYQQQMYQQQVAYPQQQSQYGNYNNAGFAQPYTQTVQTGGYQTQVNHGNTSRYGNRLKEMQESRVKEEQKYVRQYAQPQQQPQVVQPTLPVWFPGHELAYLCSPNVMEKHVEENGFTKRELVSSGKNVPLEKLKIKRGKKEMNINTCVEDIYNLYPNEVRTHDAFDVIGVERVFDMLNYKDESDAVDLLTKAIPNLSIDNIIGFLQLVPKASRKLRRELDMRYTSTFNNLLKVKGISNITIDNLVTDVKDYLDYAQKVDSIKIKSDLLNVLDIVINDIKTKLSLSILEKGTDGSGILEIKFTGALMVINNENVGNVIKKQMLKNDDKVASVTEQSFPEVSEAMVKDIKPDTIKDVVAVNGVETSRYKLFRTKNAVYTEESLLQEMDRITELHKKGENKMDEMLELLDAIGV